MKMNANMAENHRIDRCTSQRRAVELDDIYKSSFSSKGADGFLVHDPPTQLNHRTETEKQLEAGKLGTPARLKLLSTHHP